MDAEGPEALPRISDFDISKDTTLFRATLTIVNPGTVGYMAPELEEQKPCSPASDVYALGVTMWESFLPKDKHPFVLDKDGASVPKVEGLLPGLRRALESMLRRKAPERPSADVLLGFELFAQKEAAGAAPSRLEAFRASVKLLRSTDWSDQLVPCVIQRAALVQQVFGPSATG
jgi:serine/threonine protein kinase